jgi:hypothetical protein
MQRMLLCVISVLAVSATQARPAKESCQAISFSASLDVYDDFTQELGSGLVFRLKAFKAPGWSIDVVPSRTPDNDYVYPANPPLRFNGNQTLGAGYGEDAKTSFGHPHEMRFLLNQPDYDRVSSLIGNVLWPYQTASPDKARDDYFNTLKTAETGWLRLTVLSFKIAGAGDPSRIKFRVEIKLPPDFSVASGLRPRATACPSKRDYP